MIVGERGAVSTTVDLANVDFLTQAVHEEALEVGEVLSILGVDEVLRLELALWM